MYLVHSPPSIVGGIPHRGPWGIGKVRPSIYLQGGDEGSPVDAHPLQIPTHALDTPLLVHCSRGFLSLYPYTRFWGECSPLAHLFTWVGTYCWDLLLASALGSVLTGDRHNSDAYLHVHLFNTDDWCQLLMSPSPGLICFKQYYTNSLLW